MIRKMLGLAWEAAKVELANRRTPLLAPAVETVPAIDEAVEVSVTSAVTTPDRSRWQSPAFHTQTLASTKCPDCGEEKRVGWYRCSPCGIDAKRAAS